MKGYRLYIGGEWMGSNEGLEVRNPYSGEVIGKVPLAGKEDFERALVCALEAFEEMRSLPSYRRAESLGRIAAGLRERMEEVARTISLESGKPIRDARIEVGRAINTFTIAMEEAKRMGGEVIPLDLVPGSEGRIGVVRPFPIGVILGITPFNFPLNLVAHKVAPALASGNTIIVKPSPRTPLTALLLAEIFEDCGLPKGAMNVVLAPVEVVEEYLGDERIKMVTFTGSARVGWAMKGKVGRKKVTLELGGNAAVIVHRDSDIEYAARRCAAGAFSYAGQICISVQRVYVHRDIFPSFRDAFIRASEDFKAGDPLDEGTTLAPMIDEGALRRTEEWVREAIEAGAVLLKGGKRMDPFFEPTILTGTRTGMKVSCEEVFAPVAIVEPYEDIKDAVAMVNDSPYGLQAGIFTRDMDNILYAYERIEVGGLVVNDIPTYRVDHMPYGGVKMSGFGREGVRYAIQEMTEPRLLIMGHRD